MDGSHPELRTGMSCQAEIIVEQHANALYVPVQAVTRIGQTPTVYVRRGGTFEPQSIEIGLDNNSKVHVISGLEEGQEVLLTPPLEASAAAQEEQLTEAGSDADLTRRRIEESKQTATTQAQSPSEHSRGNRDESRESGQPQGDMRRPFENMSPEEREAMFERIRNMTPEEREKIAQTGSAGEDRQEAVGRIVEDSRRGRKTTPVAASNVSTQYCDFRTPYHLHRRGESSPCSKT